MHTKFDIYVLIVDIYLEFDNNYQQLSSLSDKTVDGFCNMYERRTTYNSAWYTSTNNQHLWLAVWSQCNTYISNYFHELDEKFCKI